MATFASVLGNGEFDRALVRPLNTVLQILAPRVDFTRAGLLIQAIGVLVYVIPKSNIIWEWKKIVTLVLMIGCGSVLFFSLFLFKATFSFFTIQNLDFMNILLSCKLDAPAPCRLDAPDFSFVCHVLADCLHQHWQAI